MQAINQSALDNVAADVFGCSADVLPFKMFSWDAKDAAKELTPQTGGTGKRVKPAVAIEDAGKITKESKPIFVLRKTPQDKAKGLAEAERANRVAELAKQYQENSTFEFEPSNYVEFATGLAEAYRRHTTDKQNPKGKIPTFLLDEDTIFQVESENANIHNLSELL